MVSAAKGDSMTRVRSAMNMLTQPHRQFAGGELHPKVRPLALSQSETYSAWEARLTTAMSLAQFEEIMTGFGAGREGTHSFEYPDLAEGMVRWWGCGHEAILRDQISGKITPRQATAQFVKLQDEVRTQIRAEAQQQRAAFEASPAGKLQAARRAVAAEQNRQMEEGRLSRDLDASVAFEIAAISQNEHAGSW